MLLSRALLLHHTSQLRQSPATGIFLTSGWVAAVLLTFISGQLIANNRASLASFFTYLPWVMAVLIPTLTMPVASENRRGVTERLLTLPHTPLQRIFSRFSVYMGLITIWLIGFTPLIATLYYLGEPDTGPIATGFLGSLLLAAPMLAISLALCLRAKSGVGGLLASLTACFLLLLIGTPTVTGWFASVPGLSWLPTTTHLTPLGAFQPFTTGLLNLATILQLLGLTFLALAATQTHFRITNPENRITLLAVFLLALSLIPALRTKQIDTTAESLHTPSPTTVEAFRNLPSPITFTLHLSENNPDVPPSTHTYAHSLKNQLLRLRTLAPEKIILKTSNADSSTAAAITALQAGALEQPLPTGTTYFAALTAQVSGTTAVIPSLNPAREAALEYDLLTLATNALNPTKPEIAILSANPSASSNWQESLSESFQISRLSPETPTIASTTAVLIVQDDPTLTSTTLTAIRTYLNHGGNVMLFSNPTAPNTQSPTFTTLLPEWGLNLQSNSLVADPTTATLATQSGAGAMPYPYWLQLGPSNFNTKLPFTTGLGKVFMPETSAFTLTKPELPIVLTPILTTSAQARLVPLETYRSTPAELANSNLPAASGPQVIAAMATGAFSEEATKSANLIAFASTNWLTPTSLQQAPNNLALLTGTLHYLTGQGALTQLYTKGANPRTLTRIEAMANRLTQATAATELQIATRLHAVTQKQGADPYATAEAILQMQEEEFTLRQQLRDIRAEARRRIQTMENALLLINLTLSPTLVGLFFFLQRRRQRLKATSTL